MRPCLARNRAEYAPQQSADARQSRNRVLGPSHVVLCRVAPCRKAPEALAEAAMGVSSKATVVAVVAMVEAVVATVMKESSTVGSTTTTKRSVLMAPPG